MITAARRPMAFGYARVSDDSQIKQDDSIPRQLSLIENYYRCTLADSGVDWGGVESDPTAQSAYTKNFDKRKAGARLIATMQPGDHLIFDKIDRLSRRNKDNINTLDWFKQHGITVHVLGLLGMNVNMDTSMGKLIVGIFSLLAEWEADQNSDRKNASNAGLRQTGRWLGGKPIHGTKVVKRFINGVWRPYMVWDPVKRAIMAEIVRLRDVEKLSWDKTSAEIELHAAQKAGRLFSKSAFYKRHWNISKIKRYYYTEKFIRDKAIVETTQFPVHYNKVFTEWLVESGYPVFTR